MKPILSALALASLFSLAACNRDELRQKEAAIQYQQRIIDSMNRELARQQVVDSMNEVMGMQYYVPPAAAAATAATAATAASAPRASSSSRSTRRSYSGQSTRTESQPQTVVYQQAPEPARKRGWSAKAKGAVIGAGTGAAAGAIINGRNRAAGAVIGGVLGAGAGTGVGAVIDKKKGR